jgi:membrane protease YdiL (CAAX protease family)
MRSRVPRLLVALLLLVVWLAVNMLTGRAPESATTIAAVVTQGIALQFLAASALLVAAAFLLRWPDLGFTRPRRDRLGVLWLPGAYLFVIGAAAVAVGLPSGPVLLVLLVNVALGSFSEEVMFRGFLYAGLRDRLSIWPSILITTFLFGSIHILNAFLIGHVAAAMLQSLAAMMSGLMFLAIRLRLQSIWPSILFHAAWNYGLILIGRDASPLDPDMPIPVVEVLITFLAILPLGIYPFWLLRRVARDGDGLGPALPPPPPPPAAPRDAWGSLRP